MPSEVSAGVLDVLKARPHRSCSTAEVTDALKDAHDPESVSAALKDLRTQGVIEQDVLGGWFLLTR